MNVSFIVTLVGEDRPGLVSALAERAAANGANWLDSSMAHLAGKFAGIVRLDVSEADADRLEAALRALSSTGLSLSLSIERGTAAAGTAGGELIRMELLAHDRPGIVRDISSVLARHGASIERMDSACESASFSGEAMFRAELEVRVPASVSAGEVQAALESLANELMVDLKLETGA